MTTVRMINSVGEDYVAGEEYELDETTADRFITLGYAEGELSGPVSDEDLSALDAEGHQTVEV